MNEDGKTFTVAETERPGVRLVPAVIKERSTAAPKGAVVETWRTLRGPWRVFGMSEWILRDRVSFFEEVRQSRQLPDKLRNMVVSTVVYLLAFGVVMGMSHSWQQALMSALKLPVLFLITLLICLPTLYFFNLLYGSQLTFQQTSALMMAAVTVTGVLGVAFTSIALFFLLTVGEQYNVLVLLNVAILAISSWWGLAFLHEGMRYLQEDAPTVRQRRILSTWLLIYAFVGTQMGWALRPFFGAPSQPFQVLRGGGGTFFASVLTQIGWVVMRLFGI